MAGRVHHLALNTRLFASRSQILLQKVTSLLRLLLVLCKAGRERLLLLFEPLASLFVASCELRPPLLRTPFRRRYLPSECE